MKAQTLDYLEVSHNETITPNMQRVRLHGKALANFPADCEGDYVKLHFNHQGETDLEQLSADKTPILRTFSIRRFYQNTQEIDIDIVRHEVATHSEQNSGLATKWAMNAQVGDKIAIAGPGRITPINLDADWFFFVADMTSLPALAAKIRTLPHEAKGCAVIKLQCIADQQIFKVPEGIKLVWITDDLEKTVKEQTWHSGQPFVWCACEFEDMKNLRQYFRNEKQLDKPNIYISSYWKQGVTEEGHKLLKKEDLATA